MPAKTPPDAGGAQARLRQALIAHGRPGTEWSRILGMSRPAFSDRLRGRTPFTLADAVTIADSLGLSLDALVGDDDMPTGLTLTTHGRARLIIETLEIADPPADDDDARPVWASVQWLHADRPGLHPVPNYDEVDR